MEAQTPVTDKSLSDFMYKNFKQTEKYTVTKTTFSKTKQELEEVKSVRHSPIYTTAKNTPPKKTVTFAKNSTPKKSPTKGKTNTKGVVKSKNNKPVSSTVMTSSSMALKAKVKSEPRSVIDTEDTMIMKKGTPRMSLK